MFGFNKKLVPLGLLLMPQICVSVMRIGVKNEAGEITYGIALSTDPQAFKGKCNIVSVNVCAGTTELGGECFADCKNLVHVIISNWVKEIGKRCFKFCKNLKTVIIESCPKGSENAETVLSEISEECFFCCESLETIEIPNSVLFLGPKSFCLCENLKTVILPNRLLEIGSECFHGCKSLASIKIPDTVREIGDNAFYHCDGLISLEIPNSVKRIGEGCCKFCANLKTVILPKGLSEISTGCFLACENLEKIEIPESVETIGSYAFSCCSKIKFLALPSSVKNLGEGCFSSCENLEIIVMFNGTGIGKNCFLDCINLKNIVFVGMKGKPRKPTKEEQNRWRLNESVKITSWGKDMISWSRGTKRQISEGVGLNAEMLSWVKSELFVGENPTSGSIKPKEENSSFNRRARLIKESFNSFENPESLEAELSKIMKSAGLQNLQPENEDAIPEEEDKK